MKASSFALFAVLTGLLAGCGHLDTLPPGAADRTFVGEVTNRNGGGELPPDTEVWVRIIDLSKGEERGEVLGEATIKNPGRLPVPVSIEYRAEDAVLLRSVVADARISVGGRLRYMTMTAHPVTLGNADEAHVIYVDMTTKR